MEITIKPNDKTYRFLMKDPDMQVEVQKGEEVFKGYIKSISTTGTYIVEITENTNV